MQISSADLVDIPFASDTAEINEKDAGTNTPASRRDQALPNGLVVNRRFAHAEELMTARKPILDLSLTSGIINLLEIPQLTEVNHSPSDPDPDTAPSLNDLFPDLAVYGGPTPSEESRVHNRLDEGHTSGHRVAHTSRLMDIRPVLVSSLQPAKKETLR